MYIPNALTCPKFPDVMVRQPYPLYAVPLYPDPQTVLEAGMA